MMRKRITCADIIPKRFVRFEDLDYSDVNQPLSILAKVDVKFPSRAHGSMQCFILVDTTGAKIEGIALGGNVNHFNGLLNEGCTYTLHRVIFKFTESREFQNIDGNFKCHLMENTFVEPFRLPIQFPPLPKHLIPFSEVVTRPSKSYVDVVGMIVHLSEIQYIGSVPNQRQFRDIVIIDERSKMLAISIYAEHLRRYTVSLPKAAANNEITIITMLRVDYKYGCFETSSYTKFAFNPFHHAIHDLRAFRKKWMTGMIDKRCVNSFLAQRWAYLATIVV